MKKPYVMMRMFCVNERIVMAQDITEAMSIYKQTLEGSKKEVNSAYMCRDGELCYVKIATDEDYVATHGRQED